ncbi:lumican [Rhinoraja longicauda]
MKLIQLPIFALLVSCILCQYDYNSYFGYYPANQEDLPFPVCSAECDCPYTFPTAMYCNDRKLKTIPTVPAQIKYLYLQNNQLTAIPNNAFENATDLRWIILDNNEIVTEKVGKKAFSRLKSLQRLYFNKNNLTEVPSMPKSLVELKMASNQISKIGNGLKGLENLTTLILEENRLKDVGLALGNLKSLMYLDLSTNKLTQLPVDLPPAIEMLYIDNNKIDKIPQDYLTKYPALQFLRMAHNKITDGGLPDKVFNVTSLIELDLSFNELTEIPVVNENLENLYLQANQIEKFTLSSFCRITGPVDFSRIKHLRLDGNLLTRASLPMEMSLCLRWAGEISIN